ncbi:hypothetical protein BaRGS_00013808 [Batillaria attramentaria]|uniref:Uncharacterized protein n=1 Tax=Batillaria attramentaria TaxID=370345 RepID=A0ABD0L6E3_9CAEN
MERKVHLNTKHMYIQREADTGYMSEQQREIQNQLLWTKILSRCLVVNAFKSKCSTCKPQQSLTSVGHSECIQKAFMGKPDSQSHNPLTTQV